MSEENKEKLQLAINNVEAGYEFFLAYAAQGRDIEYTGGGSGPSIRGYLADMVTGLKTIAGDFQNVVTSSDIENKDVFTDYIDVLSNDAAISLKAVNLVLSLTNISSQVIDNLNASIHLRALLTDIFLVDEAMASLSRKS